MSSNAAAIYARYSTDLQSDRSIEDQVALCRQYAEREGLVVTAVHADRARSGGTTAAREGLSALLDDARAGRVGVVIVEALDRLSRDMEDLAGLHKRLTFAGVEIRAVHEGAVNTVLVGLRGLIGQLYREDNAHKIRRGQQGRVKSGLVAGGLAYGYAVVPGEPGKRTIDEAQAHVVRRIYREYAGGKTSTEIAAGLTRDRIPSPTGGRWNASTIYGSRTRGIGILQNDIYLGKIAWNRVRMVRDPETGRRVSRANEADAQTIVAAPELEIIDADLAARVRARSAERGGAKPWTARRPKRMLSGLLRCGACGAGMSSKGVDKTGRTRVTCSGQQERGDCPDATSFYLDTIEHAVVEGLRAEMRHPALLAAYAREYHEERRRLAADTIAQRADIERRLATIGKEADRITDWLVQGIGDVARLDRRAKELMAEEVQLREQLAAAEEAPNIVALHPQALARYEEQLQNLAAALGRTIEEGDHDAAAAIRELVKTVTIRRQDDGSAAIELEGRLDQLLGCPTVPRHRLKVASGGMMVAEACFQQSPRRNVPFRLLLSA